MSRTIKKWNALSLDPKCFVPYPQNPSYSSIGKCWKLSHDIGEGVLWVYGEKDLFDIKIHNFYFHEDTVFEYDIAGYLGVFYYDSISGEQLTPYRRINARDIQSIAGNDEPYKMIIHKKIPVHCIGIGISPAYYEDYMKKHFPDEYCNPYFAFAELHQEESFPELVFLLKQIENYRGDGMAAKMFYESKISEVISLLLEHTMQKPKELENKEISPQDIQQIQNTVSYINDHYSTDIPLENLTQIACMGATKFRVTFKKIYGCTVVDYIQQRRLSHAECLLAESNLTIGQIANSVGYSTSSRLSAIFRKSAGVTPVEYRRMIQKL